MKNPSWSVTKREKRTGMRENGEKIYWIGNENEKCMNEKKKFHSSLTFGGCCYSTKREKVGIENAAGSCKDKLFSWLFPFHSTA